MKRIASLLPAAMLFRGSEAEGCTMTFPVYGIYSGGSPVLYSYLERGFFTLLLSAVALKSAAYACFARGNWGRLFVAMVVANGVTTCLGFILEGVQAFTLALFFAPAIVALLILYVATGILRSGGALTFLDGNMSTDPHGHAANADWFGR